jgi:hypothetical protein
MKAQRKVTIGDQNYTFASPSYQDWSDFLAWIQDSHISVAARNVERAPESMRQGLLQAAFDRAARMKLSDPDTLSILETPEGVVRLVAMHLKKHHPQMTLGDVEALVADPEAMKACMEAVSPPTANIPG